MNVAIVGSRTFNDWDFLLTKMQELIITTEIDCIVSGGAKGADKLGERFAKFFDIPMMIFKPDWDRYGKRAGYLRNKDIIDNADIVVAFWDCRSKGTLHSINLAKSSGKEVFVVQV